MFNQASLFYFHTVVDPGEGTGARTLAIEKLQKNFEMIIYFKFIYRLNFKSIIKTYNISNAYYLNNFNVTAIITSLSYGHQ